MTEGPQYTEYHPRWYRPRVSTYWWLWKQPYLEFVLRELSSVFVAFFVVITLMQVRALSRGPQAYAEFTGWMERPMLILASGVTFVFVVFHAITWFSLAPRAMVVRVAGKRVPGFWIAASNYAAWIVVSAAVVWLVMRG